MKRYRDYLFECVPWWLSDRRYSNGKTVGFRFLWVMVALLDVVMQWLVESVWLRMPGVGTPTALALTGRSRGVLRGQSDTDATYTAKLQSWLTKWSNAGSQLQLAIEIHEYLGNSPRVRIVNRSGLMVTVNADGSSSTAQCAWNWDGTSHPERSGFWSEIWIIVYPTQWALAGSWGTGTWGDSTYGFGHDVPNVDVNALRGLIGQWKAAHTKVRSVIWTSDSALFDPAVPLSLPDGQWGEWTTTGSGARVASHRNLTSCRYWEGN